MVRLLYVSCASLTCFSCASEAPFRSKAPEPTRDVAEAPAVYDVPFVSTPLVLDGKLEDGAWESAPWSPVAGHPNSQA